MATKQRQQELMENQMPSFKYTESENLNINWSKFMPSVSAFENLSELKTKTPMPDISMMNERNNSNPGRDNLDIAMFMRKKRRFPVVQNFQTPSERSRNDIDARG